MDWRMFTIPITTQTETLLPLRQPNFTAPPISMTSPRPVSPLRNSITGLSGWWDEMFAAGFVDPEDKRKIEESDAKLKQLNEEALARGAITPEVYEITSKHIEDNDYKSMINDPDMSVFRAFIDGAQDGLLDDLALAKAAAQKVSSGIFGAIPTGVYITVGVALLALYLFKKR